MRGIVFFISWALANFASAQIDVQKVIIDSEIFQNELIREYADKKTSPLAKKERKTFSGLEFYPIDTDYAVMATFEKISDPDTIRMQTSRDTVKYYITFAKIYFSLQGESCELFAYQSITLRDIEEYKAYLFIPFRDKTSGTDSYGGGRYLDITIPESKEVLINFNVAYNPYCAYTKGYNCPLPPPENTLGVAVNAGVKVPF